MKANRQTRELRPTIIPFLIRWEFDHTTYCLVNRGLPTLEVKLIPPKETTVWISQEEQDAKNKDLKLRGWIKP
jgi:hypothetical protein